MRAAIVVAGGTGVRSLIPGGKQLALVAGEPLVAHCLRAFDASRMTDVVVLVCLPGHEDEYRVEAVEKPGVRKVSSIVAGGVTRSDSVAAGLAALPEGVTIVAVHDGARPMVGSSTIDRAIDRLESDAELDGVVVGHPAFDTVKTAAPSGRVIETPDRAGLWIAQTPQVFRAGALIRAYARAAVEGWEATDDAGFVERAGGSVAMLEGPRWNIKVTVGQDIEVVESLLALRDKEGLS